MQSIYHLHSNSRLWKYFLVKCWTLSSFNILRKCKVFCLVITDFSWLFVQVFFFFSLNSYIPSTVFTTNEHAGTSRCFIFCSQLTCFPLGPVCCCLQTCMSRLSLTLPSFYFQLWEIIFSSKTPVMKYMWELQKESGLGDLEIVFDTFSVKTTLLLRHSLWTLICTC